MSFRMCFQLDPGRLSNVRAIWCFVSTSLTQWVKGWIWIPRQRTVLSALRAMVGLQLPMIPKGGCGHGNEHAGSEAMNPQHGRGCIICIESMVSWFLNFRCFRWGKWCNMDQKWHLWQLWQYSSKRPRNWCNKDCVWLDEGRCVPGPQELRYEDRCSVMPIAAHFVCDWYRILYIYIYYNLLIWYYIGYICIWNWSQFLINYYNHGEYNHMQNLGTSKSEYCAPTVCDFGSAECSRTWCYICIYTVIHTYIYI